MSVVSKQLEASDIRPLIRRARKAAHVLATLSGERRNEALLAAANAIEARADEILAANEKDCAAAQQAVERGELSRAMFARLRTTERGVAEMAAKVREVAQLPDPLHRRLATTELDDGLVLHKETCPLGVVGVVFESRPEVVVQISSLALKSGNAVCLKGGAEAAESNATLVSIWRDALSAFPDVPVDSVVLIHTREDVAQILTLHEDIDLIVPRGSDSFVRYVMEHSRIPVLGHGEGICHVYVHSDADLRKAIDVSYDSKVQYPAVCNAMETLLVHQEIAPIFLPVMIKEFRNASVEVRGCARTQKFANGEEVIPATEEDWKKEYSDLIVSIKVVDGVNEAIEHINRYGSRHTESIVTESHDVAARFMEFVDAANVFQNASTRFSDGFRYGLGAEVGISTGKLHARGPVGLEGLTIYKYKLFGKGQTVASYSKGQRTFKHRTIEG
ncbi:MAG TPA: glutamate-5-semialdehyde dehydrogenase [Verrucomicrobiae bacterium]|jgi:glutamate-5-semialdehyde dehydrogenase|nr:glutamate-5-semialdehyde dehydrogenase [Verrucomicrobiae bacterium]